MHKREFCWCKKHYAWIPIIECSRCDYYYKTSKADICTWKWTPDACKEKEKKSRWDQEPPARIAREWVKSDTVYCCDDDYTPIYDPDEGHVVADVWLASDGGGYKRGEENANIIAAAPELLAALKGVLPLVEKRAGRQWSELAKRAIAKAEGKGGLRS